MRPLRLLPLLVLSALAPAAMAQVADMRVSLTMPATAYANNSYAYAVGTLTITNAGNVPAQDVTFDFGGGLALSLPYKNVSCNAPRFTQCKVLSIVPGSVTVPISAEWDYPPAAGTVETTSVTVSSASTPDPDFTNNTTSATTTIVWQSDLTFDSLDVPSAPTGATAAIGATFRNHGPSPATDFSLTISIPPGARYEGYLGGSVFHCTEPPVGGHGDLVCATSSYQYGNGPDSIQAFVSVDPSLAPGTVLPVNATLASTTALKSRQTASGALTVTAPTSPDAAVSVSAKLDGPSVVVGYWMTETYTISNAGPHDAELVTLDVRPTGGYAQFVATSTAGACSGIGPIHCTLATLAAGHTMSLTVVVPTYPIGTFTSTAVVTWLHGGPAVASSELVVTSGKPARRRAARH